MEVNNYHLVLWLTANTSERTTSVLSERDVKISKKKVTAKWGSKWFDAKVLMTSSKSDILF